MDELDLDSQLVIDVVNAALLSDNYQSTSATSLPQHDPIHNMLEKNREFVGANEPWPNSSESTDDADDISKEKPFHCHLCSRTYVGKASLSDHIKVHNDDRRHRCNECGKGFVHPYQLKVHLRRHLGVKPFTCSECNRGFVNRSSLLEHFRQHTGERLYDCSFCGKKFSTSSNLTKHTRSVHLKGHNMEVCPVCGKCLKSRSTMEAHMMIHKDEKPFRCDSCDKTFTQRSQLLSHKRYKHMNARNYTCSHCGKKFVRNADVVRHRDAVHSNKSRSGCSCKVCGRRFKYLNHLNLHLRCHKAAAKRGKDFCSSSDAILLNSEGTENDQSLIGTCTNERNLRRRHEKLSLKQEQTILVAEEVEVKSAAAAIAEENADDNVELVGYGHGNERTKKREVKGGRGRNTGRGRSARAMVPQREFSDEGMVNVGSANTQMHRGDESLTRTKASLESRVSGGGREPKSKKILRLPHTLLESSSEQMPGRFYMESAEGEGESDGPIGGLIATGNECPSDEGVMPTMNEGTVYNDEMVLRENRKATRALRRRFYGYGDDDGPCQRMQLGSDGAEIVGNIDHVDDEGCMNYADEDEEDDDDSSLEHASIEDDEQAYLGSDDDDDDDNDKDDNNDNDPNEDEQIDVVSGSHNAESVSVGYVAQMPGHDTIGSSGQFVVRNENYQNVQEKTISYPGLPKEGEIGGQSRENWPSTVYRIAHGMHNVRMLNGPPFNSS